MVLDPLIGQQIASYRLERILGRGGMATVYYGWDTRLERPVAIKIIAERYREQPAFLARFMREAGMIASLRHPNILQVYHAGEETDLVYFVMEYIPGRDLERLLADQAALGRRLPASEVLRIGWAVAGALDYAHGRGVIHRDVKPSNVIIADDGRIVLSDFGLAMDLARGTLGEVFGSPHYIAPEQARSSSQATPLSDLYSLGVMLYEMLAGALPFNDPSPVGLVYQHANLAPPSPRAFNPALGAGVEAVLLKALSKAPTERYPSGRDLMEALSTALDEGLSGTQPNAPGMAATLPLPAARPGSAAAAGPAAASASRGAVYTPAHPRWGWGAGCALVLVVLLLAGLAAWGAQSAGLLSALFPGAPPDPSPSPSLQPTLPAAAPISSETPLPPSATPTLTPSPTSTLTPTASPTATLTPTPALGSLQLALTRKTDSLLVTNGGKTSLSLQDFYLKAGSAQLQANEWKSVTLDPGECLLVLSSGRDADRVGSVGCKQAHSPIVHASEHPLWTGKFDVYYHGDKVATCSNLSSQNACTVRYPLATATPAGYP